MKEKRFKFYRKTKYVKYLVEKILTKQQNNYQRLKLVGFISKYSV